MALTSAQRSANYRAKDVEAYRPRPRDLATTPKHAARRVAYMQRWRKENQVAYNAHANEYNTARRKSRTPEARHEDHIKRVYRITRVECLSMLESQDGKCAICREDQPRGHGNQWHVDHCHATGVVRGLLCNWCNARLGWYEKHKEAAADYLARGPHQFHDGARLVRPPKEFETVNQKISHGVKIWWAERKAKLIQSTTGEQI